MAVRISRVLRGADPNGTSQSTPPQPGLSAASASSTATSEKNDPNMVSLSETVSQTNGGKVKKLPRHVIKEYRNNYIAYHKVEPPDRGRYC